MKALFKKRTCDMCCFDQFWRSCPIPKIVRGPAAFYVILQCYVLVHEDSKAAIYHKNCRTRVVVCSILCKLIVRKLCSIAQIYKYSALCININFTSIWYANIYIYIRMLLSVFEILRESDKLKSTTKSEQANKGKIIQ